MGIILPLNGKVEAKVIFPQVVSRVSLAHAPRSISVLKVSFIFVRAGEFVIG